MVRWDWQHPGVEQMEEPAEITAEILYLLDVLESKIGLRSTIDKARRDFAEHYFYFTKGKEYERRIKPKADGTREY